MADYSALHQTIDANINDNGRGAITGPILNDVLNEMVDVLGDGGGANLTGYVSVESIADLPEVGEPTLGYLIGTDLYLYVGEGGDTLDGKYENCGPFRGPAGASNVLSIGEVTEGEEADASISGASPSQRLNLTLPLASVPFKGLFDSLNSLKAAYTATEGDYAYVVNSETTARIYIYGSSSTNNHWADSGLDVDLSGAVISPLNDSVKSALLNCFSKVAWIDNNAQEYISRLRDALSMKEVLSITATFTQGSSYFGTNSELESLKANLVVTATYSDGTTRDLDDAEYELSGTLTKGTSTIVVSYEELTTTFNVQVSTYVLDASQFIIAGASADYHASNNTTAYDYVYNMNGGTIVKTRIVYPLFDLGIESGKTYKITYVGPTISTMQIGVLGYKSGALTSVANHTTIASSNIIDGGWVNLTDGSYDYTAPSGVEAIRLNHRRDTTNTNFTDIPFTQVVIDEQ